MSANEEQQRSETSEVVANPADPSGRGGGPEAEAPPEALLDPSQSEMEAFLAWRETQPREFWGVIDEHGKEAYELAFLTWQAGSALGALAGLSQEALRTLAAESARLRKVAQGLHPGLQQSWGALQTCLSKLAEEVLELRGIDPQVVLKAQTDLGQAAQLAASLGGAGGSSGLVVVKH